MIRSQFLNGYFDYECLIEQLVLHPHKPEIGIEELKDVVRSNVSYRGSSYQEVLPFLGLLMLPHKEDVGEIIKKILKGSNVYRDNESLYRVHMNKKDNGYVRAFLWNWDKSYEEKIKEINSKPPEPSLPIENVFDERSLNKFIRCWVKSIAGVTESIGGNRGKEMTIESWKSPLCNTYRKTLAFEVLSKRNKHPYRKEIEVTPIVRSLYREDLKKALRQKPIDKELLGEYIGEGTIKFNSPIVMTSPFPYNKSIETVMDMLNPPENLSIGSPGNKSELLGLSLKKKPSVLYRVPLELVLGNISIEEIKTMGSRELIIYPQDPLVASSCALKLLLGKEGLGQNWIDGRGIKLLGSLILKSPVGSRTWSYIIKKLPIETSKVLKRLLCYKIQNLPSECLIESLGLFSQAVDSIESRRLKSLGSLVFEYIHEPHVCEAVKVQRAIVSELRVRLITNPHRRERMHGIFMNGSKRKRL